MMNAYVDGELTPAQSARVASAIADDPQLAAMVAKLHAMKSAVADVFDNQEVIAITPARTVRSSSSFKAVAASIFVVLIGGGIWLAQLQQVPNNLVGQAFELHDNWASTSLPGISLAATPPVIVTPNLEPAGLTLAGVEENLRLGEISASRYAYVGSRGCKLSLFVTAQATAFVKLEESSTPKGLIAKWADKNTGFMLIARRMNPDRFKVIAKALKKATSKSLTLDEPMRQAMVQSRQPCLA